jgi:hypothetical protein
MVVADLYLTRGGGRPDQGCNRSFRQQVTEPDHHHRDQREIAWGVSSAGRAREWHSRGQGFESPTLHCLERWHVGIAGPFVKLSALR